MTGETIFGMIMMIGCGFGCGALCYGLGVWAAKRKTPMGFWTGVEIDPKKVSDIPAYNRANARMWKLYSIPYWLTGLAGFVSIFDIRASALAGILILLGCTVGIGWLIWVYKRICKRYMV